ncbi:hypothetical protein F511_28258 [Dorcoceras hygrometricum]|uniref:Uncharacterized protein n=1 Tax=Dorcoceras hygrometricum TaxID=472368 RepID=A0A2Z7B2U0_9LAMI|nr:hypothetical protein F511_28258 [Dorcoceras hygrometricum]
MSDGETILLNLFDFYWFEHGVLTEKKSPLSAMKKSSVLQVEVEEEGEIFEKPKLKPIKTLMRKSLSDQFLSSKDCSDSSGSPSPDSFLVPQLQTILSGKEIDGFAELTKEIGSRVQLFHTEPSIDEGRKRGRRAGRRGSGKSLSELEFQELKGFMDLGFVFSDEDKDSRLVSIIPGLQRLGINRAEESDKGFGKVSVSRPYLSEAWEFSENPLMGWRIPAFGNEMELKDHLRYWAHTVASTVR